MKRLSWGWYLLIALVALVPVGLRALTWHGSRHQPVDAAMAQAGQTLFTHEWTPNDPLAPGGDGLGPVFNANSCVACHKQGGLGGSGGLQNNVTTFTVRTGQPHEKPREGVVHARAVRFQETLSQVNSELPEVSQPPLAMLVSLPNQQNSQRLRMPSGVHVSQRNTPALFGARLIDELPAEAIIAAEKAERLRWGLAPASEDDAPVGRALRLPGGKVGRFGWKAQMPSLADFVQAACANELGLGNPGQAQPRPLGRPDYRAPGLDLTLDQCNQLTAYCLALPRPVERLPDNPAAKEQADAGRSLFHSVGCADCHTPNLGSVDGLYSDLLLHRMGVELEGGGSYGDPPIPIPDPKGGSPSDGPGPGEWRTPPLWGVADSAPYLHDGRAATLDDAIRLHAGQGAHAEQRFAALSLADQYRLVAFLRTLRAP